MHKKTGVALAALLILAAAFSFAAEIVDEIEAVVDGKAIITRSEVDLIASSARGSGDVSEIRAEAFKIAVDRALVLLEAQKRKITVSEEELSKAIDSIRQKNGMEEEDFRSGIEKEGISFAQYREEIKNQILATKLTLDLARTEYPSPEAALREYYQRHAGEFPSNRWARFLHVSFPAGEAGTPEEKIREEMRAGKGFAEAVLSVTGSGPEDTGNLAEKDLSPAVASAVAGLSVGETSSPATIGDRAFLFHLAETGGEKTTFEGVKEEVYQRFMAGGMREVLEGWLSVRRDEARVQKMR